MSELSLSLVVATWFQPEALRCISSWREPALLVPYRGILDAYQLAYEQTTSSILMMIHDDLLCRDLDWKARVLAEFADPTVAIVGFAGAPGYGHPQMYSQPYHHSSLGRVGFCSNLANAERHGARFTGSRAAGVLDGMALIVRRAFLDQIGGWEWRRGGEGFLPDYDYYLYAEALCFHALRRQQKVRLVGVACEHLDHRSTGLNPNLRVDFEGEHNRLWTEFKDVLPVMVEERQ